MKHFSPLIPVLLLPVALSFAPAEERTSSHGGPVSFWSFDDSLKDEANDGKDDLTIRDGGKYTPRFVDASEVPGAIGKAVALGVKPGDAQYFTARTSADVKLGPDYTIEAWIQPTEFSQWNRLVLNWGTKHAYHLAIHNGVLSLYHGQASGAYVFAEGGRMRTGRWQHVAGIARRDNADPSKSRLEVYLNGRLTGAAQFDGTIATLEREDLGIGDSAGIPSAPVRFRGYIDEVSIWKRSLSADDIRAHYAKRSALLAGLEAAQRKAEAERRSKWFRSKKVEAEEIVFAERHPGRDTSRHYYANFGYSCIDPDYWIHGSDGGRLCKLNLRTGELTVLLDDPNGAVRDPQVHYDGEKILFSYRKAGGHHYNLYEINCDGTGLRQITTGPWDDIEPAYLPDGDIMFCSSRCKRYILCWLAQSALLFRCSPDGKDIRMLSSGTVTENTPAVLPDGRVLYTRWEYVNRDPVVFHHLWMMNPDGTSQKIYYGNMHPGGVFIDARPIPGTDKVIFIHSPGHGRNEHEGAVAIVSHRSGPDERSAMRHISRGGNFRDPYPLSEGSFLVAQGNRILFMSADGKTDVLYSGSLMVHEPRPILRRKRERVIPSLVDASKTTGTLVLENVYLGRNMAGIEQGRIKKLLVLEDLPKPANFHGGGSQPIGHGVTSTLKRLLGTVPVEPDGSACFKVPAMRSIYFALLDENDVSVKQMRSFVTLQPGETKSCVGCHEYRTQAPGAHDRHQLQALARAPSLIEPIAEVPEIIDYPRDVQPILDKHCVRCHGHEKRDGGVSLVGDRGPVFSQSYYELFLHWQIKDTGGNPGYGSGRQRGNDKPYTTYSSASPLMKKIDVTHYDVRVTPRERKTIRLWIDVSAQYAGTAAAIGTGQVGGMWGNNRPVRVMADRWASTGPAMDAVKQRCAPCHGRMLPAHVTAQVPVSHGDMLSWERPLSRFSRHRIFNLSRPERSLALLAPLAKTSGGYAVGHSKTHKVTEDRRRPPRPIEHSVIFADKSDPDYRKILAHIQAAKLKLDEIKRFDMPGFKPNKHYVREMKRYGILPESFDLAKDKINVYEADKNYWKSMWHQPKAMQPSAMQTP